MSSFGSRLRKYGITEIDASRGHFECNQCGQRWSPNFKSGGGFVGRDWFHCPNGCNTEEVVTKDGRTIRRGVHVPPPDLTRPV